MRRVTCSMGISLDGYIKDARGSFDWSTPSREAHDLATEEVRGLSVHLLGRRLFETMTYWDTVEQHPDIDFTTRAFAQVWRALPKVVFSRTLTEVPPGYRLATRSLADEITALKEGEGEIALGGAELVHQAADADLIDEYRLRVLPVLVGGGTPLFPRNDVRANLELQESRTLDQVHYLRYGVVR